MPCYATALLALSLLAPAATLAAPSQATYDFVVVGGGIGGVTVAKRVAEYLPGKTVLLIEAGPDGRANPQIYIPGRKGSLLGSAYDWNFTTIPQPAADNRVLAQGRGRVLGGSSALNLLSWDRGAKVDYNSWEELGNSGWGWDELFPFMKKAETYQPSSVNGASGIQGTGFTGPIHYLVNRLTSAQNEAFFPAVASLGLKQTYDFLAGQPLGWMRHTSNILQSNYTRSYSPAYLAEATTNLHVLLNSTVAKVNIDGSKCAKGVTLLDGTIIYAKREVILSAGSIQSPQLLELSGVGNATILAAAGVKQLVNLPSVGENLQDHIRIVATYQLKPNYTSPDILRFNATYAAEQLALYNRNITSLYDNAGTAYLYANFVQAQGNDTALVAAAQGAQTGTVVYQKKLQNLKDKSRGAAQLEVLLSDGYLGNKGYPVNGTALYGSQFFALIGVLMHPFSVGSTHLNASSSIVSKPRFNPNYLSNPYDAAAITQIAKYLRKIANTPPLSNTWQSEYEPGVPLNTDAEWTAWARQNFLSIWHPVGTCAMLPKSKGGVVDTELKVYGVNGLRVVDASVIPMLQSGHISTGIYGIAEKAAAAIGKEWKGVH
nr:hypothetical protein B0A51_02608 [Rachicladosporium sp. CCFEE 5018]